MNQYDDTSENFGNVAPEEYAKRRAQQRDRGGNSKFQTLIERRAQGWDWLTMDVPNDSKAVLYITRVMDDHVEVGVATENSEGGEAPRVYTVSGDFDKTITMQEPMARYKLTIAKHDQGWDGLHVIFPGRFHGEDIKAEIYLSRVWYRRMALTVLAPRKLKLRKIEAQG